MTVLHDEPSLLSEGICVPWRQYCADATCVGRNQSARARKCGANDAPGALNLLAHHCNCRKGAEEPEGGLNLPYLGIAGSDWSRKQVTSWFIVRMGRHTASSAE